MACRTGTGCPAPALRSARRVCIAVPTVRGGRCARALAGSEGQGGGIPFAEIKEEKRASARFGGHSAKRIPPSWPGPGATTGTRPKKKSGPQAASRERLGPPPARG